MAKLTMEQWSQLLSTAAQDSAFRERLATSPKEAAQTLGIDLDDASAASLKQYLEAVRIFGTNAQPDEPDAAGWALRLVHVPHKPAPKPRGK